MQYTLDILNSKVDENNVRMYEVNRLITSNSSELDKYTLLFENLMSKIDQCNHSLKNLKNLDGIVLQSLNEKLKLCESEKNRLVKITDELEIYKEDYLYELSSLREENRDIKESLELLENYSKKIIRESSGVQLGELARLS